ncbi:similar to dynamin family protein [Plenodomus lingam JN3]|uniref:Similar to dynamin family protein n=2 Tax=Leptosphaeria maculans TaxID=5022 RepID=E4ZXT2_LEPMJ|nr:similar to dynamin family protein [Plenodomus lingam JN3]CBX96177.1 similar to dynamin family protein [Plenodomus lingam JN3]
MSKRSSKGLKPNASAAITSDEGENSDTTLESRQSTSRSTRDETSRLSEELEPMSIDDVSDQSSSNVAPHDEIDPLGRDVKEAATALSQLEGLGLQKFDISLPRCIVLGQQSTGKSSVIEAISGIKTPRDTDTCTCCPLYINMKPSNTSNDTWTARVSLQRDYVLDTRPKEAAKELFPGWIPTESRRIFFAETRSRLDLEGIIRSAQSANLNPLIDPKAFLATPGPRIDMNQNKFSPNVVCIDITEPGLPSLSFFDLPGLISQAETDEEAYTVPLVQNLVGQYVEEEGSLILVTCDLGTDIANSTAAGLARQYHATDRCIGVLTKPDLLAPGTTDQSLLNVLDGKRFKLGHGYFVVKNLNKQEIRDGLGHREARANEMEFFSKGRWASNLRRFQDRFGTKNLQLYLSKQLAKRTFNRLPEIRSQIRAQLNDIENELERIPVTPAHSAVRAITDHIMEFSLDVRYEMEGEHGYTEWWNTWERIQNDFRNALMAMKPALMTKGLLDEGIYACTLPGTSADNAFPIDSDDDDDIPMHDVQVSPKKRKLEDSSQTQSSSKSAVMGAKQHPKGSPSKRSEKKPVPSGFAKFKKSYNLDAVVHEISQSSKSKIPNQIHPKVRDAMIVEPLKDWRRPMNLLFSNLENEISSRMQFLFNKHFVKRQGTELFQQSWKIIHEILSNNINQQQTTMAQEALEDELEGPYIFHQDVFNQEKATVREIYRQHRQHMRFGVFLSEANGSLGRKLTQNEQDKVRKDNMKMALIAKEPEPYEKVIDLIAEITSYYNIAARRFHDSICMRIESKFFKQLRTQLREELETGLGIRDEDHGPVIAQRLLVKSPEHEKRRQQLLIRKEALSKGLECLSMLDVKYQCVSSGSADGATDEFGHEGSDSFMITPPVEGF